MLDTYTYLTLSPPNFLWRHPVHVYYCTVNTIQVMTEADFDGVPDVPLHVINNYFSIGADAQIALLFHNERGTVCKCDCGLCLQARCMRRIYGNRGCDDLLAVHFVISEANPEKLDSRLKNKFFHFKVSHLGTASLYWCNYCTVHFIVQSLY